MRKRGIFVLFSVCLFLVWCGWPSYEDAEMQKLHNQIVECYSFTPTCEEYQEHKANWDKDIGKYIMFNNSEMYENDCKELILKLMKKDLDLNLDKGEEWIEVTNTSLEYYAWLERWRKEKMEPEIQKYTIWEC